MNVDEIEGYIEEIKKDGDDTIINVRIKHAENLVPYIGIDDFSRYVDVYTSKEELMERYKKHEKLREERKRQVADINNKIDNIKLGMVILKW